MRRRSRERSRRAAANALIPLEGRRLLSAGAQPVWNVSIVDPGETYAAYEADLTRVIQAAGHEWGRLFDSTASIEVSVVFNPALATASGRSLTTAFLYHNTDGYDIYEQGAAAEINTGIDPNGAAADVEISIGVKPGASYLDQLWFDPDPAARNAPVPAGKIDAMSVMMHELGHAIAYNGWSDWTTGQLPGTYASAFDEYIYSSGGELYFGGAFAHDVYGADPALMPGDIYHWGPAGEAPGGDLPMQLMNGVSLAAQTRYEISPLDVAVMNDVGMNMDTSPPALVSSTFHFDTGQEITLKFAESVRASFDVSDLTLVRVGPGPVSTVPAVAMELSYDRASDTATITFPGLTDHLMSDGTYQLSISAAGVSDLAGNPMSADATFSFFVLSGDANHDGSVGFADLVAVAQNYGQGSGTTFAQGDFNYDGSVDFADLVIVAQKYGATIAQPVGAVLAGGPQAGRLNQGRRIDRASRRPLFSLKPIVKVVPPKLKTPRATMRKAASVMAGL